MTIEQFIFLSPLFGFLCVLLGQTRMHLYAHTRARPFLYFGLTAMASGLWFYFLAFLTADILPFPVDVVFTVAVLLGAPVLAIAALVVTSNINVSGECRKVKRNLSYIRYVFGIPQRQGISTDATDSQEGIVSQYRMLGIGLICLCTATAAMLMLRISLLALIYVLFGYWMLLKQWGCVPRWPWRNI
ncbi:MAG TPA: hypothetical protein PKH07_16305 [bacterium]|nr:hypothetical protein [bacterium]